MALTNSQKKLKLDVIDKKIKKLETAASEIEALRAERAWYEQAPTVADKGPRQPRKTKAQKATEAEALAAAGVEDASADNV
jgi:hypothetical protein